MQDCVENKDQLSSCITGTVSSKIKKLRLSQYTGESEKVGGLNGASKVSTGSSRGLGRAIVEAGLAAGNKVLRPLGT